MRTNHPYEVVIGLEVHAQLNVNTKLFSSNAIVFGASPNSQVNAIVLAHPGTLPKTNKMAVELAIQLGIACNCNIVTENWFARKNYFYSDLPKGYQISQHTTPICTGGWVAIEVNGSIKNIELNRIHIEEDAGKSIHDLDDDYTLIDLNRAGTPLLEIVTEPCMHSAEEAFEYLTELRKLVRWINVCDGNMEEGSLRCDANISIRPAGQAELGTKVEVKNLNSIKFVKKAIEYEVERMIILAQNNEPIIQQTRSFNASSGTTFATREKEEANDYRYFADPDLPPFEISVALIEHCKQQLPILPNMAKQQLLQWQLTAYDAAQITDDRATYQYFLQVTSFTNNYKAIANWMNGPIRQWLNHQNNSIDQLPLQPKQLADLIVLVQNNQLSFSSASAKLLPHLFNNPQANAAELAVELQLLQTHNNTAIEEWVLAVMNAMPDKVEEYKKGKKGLIGLFVGEVKKISKGQADPKIVTQLLEEKLKQ
jgi:aspartyl-tRNA(Asn)/glutamyl-tRNA(Gln) amidotransferase subunit B